MTAAVPPAGLLALTDRVAMVARVAAELDLPPAPSAGCGVGMPPAAAPLERTEGCPWVWVSAQARRSGVAAELLAQALCGDPDLVAAIPRPGGFVELTLAPEAVTRMLEALVLGEGLPDTRWTPAPEPGADVRRFEAARRAGGAPPLPADVLARRTLGNPVVVVQIAHARAARACLDEAGVHPLVRTASALVTELLESPRRLARQRARPQELAATLLAVATAYLAWVEQPLRRAGGCAAGGTAGEPAAPGDPGALLVSRATRTVLERGTALLGVHAPERM